MQDIWEGTRVSRFAGGLRECFCMADLEVMIMMIMNSMKDARCDRRYPGDCELVEESPDALEVTHDLGRKAQGLSPDVLI